MLGQIKKFFGLELPSGYQRANDFIAKNSDYPEFFRAMEGSLEKVGDDRFYIPSGDDRYIINREVPTDKTWIGGQRIYRYGFFISAFPNNTTLTTSIDEFISPLYITSILGITTNGIAYFSLPRPDNATTATAIEVWVDINGFGNVDLQIRTRWDASTYSGYVFVEYIKSMAKSQSNYIVQVSPKES